MSRSSVVGDLDFVGIDFVYLGEVPSFAFLLRLAEDEDAFMEGVVFIVCLRNDFCEAFHGGVVIAGG